MVKRLNKTKKELISPIHKYFLMLYVLLPMGIVLLFRVQLGPLSLPWFGIIVVLLDYIACPKCKKPINKTRAVIFSNEYVLRKFKPKSICEQCGRNLRLR